MLAEVLDQLRRQRARLDRQIAVLTEPDAIIADQLERVRGVLGDGAVPEGPQDACNGSRRGTGDAVTADPEPPERQRQGRKSRKGEKRRRSHDRVCATCGTRFRGVFNQLHRSPTCRARSYVQRKAEAADAAVDIDTQSAPEPVTEVTTLEPPAAPDPGNDKEILAAKEPPGPVPSLPPVRAFATKRCPKCLDTFVLKDPQQRYCSDTCEAEAMEARAAIGLPPPGEHARA